MGGWEVIQEMTPPPTYPLTREGINSEKKNMGSEGHCGQTGHLVKTHPGHYGCDVSVAFLKRDGATSATADLDGGRGGGLQLHDLQGSFKTSIF